MKANKILQINHSIPQIFLLNDMTVTHKSIFMIIYIKKEYNKNKKLSMFNYILYKNIFQLKNKKSKNFKK